MPQGSWITVSLGTLGVIGPLETLETLGSLFTRSPSPWGFTPRGRGRVPSRELVIGGPGSTQSTRTLLHSTKWNPDPPSSYRRRPPGLPEPTGSSLGTGTVGEGCREWLLPSGTSKGKAMPPAYDVRT